MQRGWELNQKLLKYGCRKNSAFIDYAATNIIVLFYDYATIEAFITVLNRFQLVL